MPVGPLALENVFPFGCQPIVTTAPLAGFLDPPSGNQSPPFQAVEHGVERGDVEFEQAVRTVFDELADLIPMTSAVLDERKDQQLRAAFFQFPVKHWQYHMSYKNIWRSNL